METAETRTLSILTAEDQLSSSQSMLYAQKKGVRHGETGGVGMFRKTGAGGLFGEELRQT